MASSARKRAFPATVRDERTVEPGAGRAGSSRRTKAGAAPGARGASGSVPVPVPYGDVTVARGVGGEVQSVGQPGAPSLTTQQGARIADDQNSLRAGHRGPTLLEDFVLREKMFHFDHERIPERVVHARGYGAKGYFETYESASDLTRADLFQRRGQRTEVFVRFSTVAGSEGSPDLARDVRGFAVKFYTAEGNWDLVGNNIPVFFIQDAMKFPDLIHAAKPEPDRGFPQAQTAHDNFWDFISLMPEAMHMVMWIMSDRAIPRSLRFMQGFGVHTFRFVDAARQSRFVKFHWRPRLGMQSVLWDEAVKINGADPDFHRRDLWKAITSGDFPEWELGVQVFDEDFADRFAFDVLDATKLIPEEEVPIRPLGRMVLNATVDNFFAETEQVAFCTQNIVPGIDFSDDPLLQGRNFSYLDTQLKRLGSPNFTQLPVNAARCPIAHFQQDGHMAMTNPVGSVNYEPNSFGGGPIVDPVNGFTSVAEPRTGSNSRERSATFADHYSQARQFYRSQTDLEREHIASALVFELSKVLRPAIRTRMLGHLVNIDDVLAHTVATGLGTDVPERLPPAVEPRNDLAVSPALSMMSNPPGTFAGRTLAVMVTTGADAKTLRALRKAAGAEGATLSLLAPTISGVLDNAGAPLDIDGTIEGNPSVLFDAIALVAPPPGAALLAVSRAAQMFVSDAHAHGKFIAFGDGAQVVLTAAGVTIGTPTEGHHPLKATGASATAFFTACRDLRCWSRLATPHAIARGADLALGARRARHQTQEVHS